MLRITTFLNTTVQVLHDNRFVLDFNLFFQFKVAKKDLFVFENMLQIVCYDNNGLLK